MRGSFSSAVRSLAEHRGLILTLARRELERRYRGSVLGLFWIILVPIATLAVYTYVFRYVFVSKVPVSANADAFGTGAFALYLFVGLMFFTLVAETLSRAPNLILENAVYVKKVKFPLEILPVVVVLCAVFNMLLSFAVWLVFYVALVSDFSPYALLAPFAALPLVFYCLGAC